MKSYPTYGRRPIESLENIPPRLWSHHEFCFFLHDQIGALLKQYEAAGVHRLVSDAVARAAANQGQQGAVDVLDVLKRAGLTKATKHMLLSHLILALTSDMLHFIFEGLRCLERRKFSVAFSLLRKPFKENMLFLAWLLGDPEDFLNRFERDNYKSLNGLQSERRTELLRLAIGRLATSAAFDAELIEKIVFSKELVGGLEPLWQKATHLITSQGSNLKTGDMSINFIFSDPSSDRLYDAVYDKLPYLMLFLTQLSLRTFSEASHTNVATTNHLVFTSLCALECLTDGRVGPVTRSLLRPLRPQLACLHCEKQLRITSQTALAMFFQERVQCASCGLVTDVPFFWLLSKSNVRLLPDDVPNAFDAFMQEIAVVGNDGEGREARANTLRHNA